MCLISLFFLAKAEIKCPHPVISKNGKYLEIVQLKSGKHIIRLLEYISGIILNKVPPSTDLYYEVGEMVANLDVAMQVWKTILYRW